MRKIATWNVNSLKVRLAQVLDWLAAEQPDVLALQETKLQDADFPADAIRAAGYEVVYAGQKTYNGVAVLSRLPATDVITGFAGHDDPQRRVLGATVGGVRVLDLYVPNGQAVGSDKYAYKLDWLARLAAQLETERAAHAGLVVLGDFNIAPEDCDVHDPLAWRDQILCSAPERAAFRGLLDAGFCDAFRLFGQPPQSFSWWDYRGGGFRRNLGLRIDHILLSPALAGRCTACRIDTGPRRLERPSDHAPVIAEFSD